MALLNFVDDIGDMDEFIGVSCTYYCKFGVKTKRWAIAGVTDLDDPKVCVVNMPTPQMRIPGFNTHLRRGHFINPKTMCLTWVKKYVQLQVERDVNLVQLAQQESKHVLVVQRVGEAL